MDEAAYREAEAALWRCAGAEPSEHRVRLERVGVTVRVQETGSGPPIAFFSGASTGGAVFARMAGLLPQFRCLLVDRPGTGLSEPLGRNLQVHDIMRLGDHLVGDVLSGLGIDSAHVAATSYGGYMALRSAAAEPDRVMRMVQFSWPFGSSRAKLPMVMKGAAIPGARWLTGAMPPSRTFVKMIFRGLGHKAALADGRIAAEDIDAFLALLRHTDTMRNELATGRSLMTFRGIQERLVLDDQTLSAITAPTLLLWGENDPIGGPEIGGALAARIPEASVEVVAGGGHAPWLDDLKGVTKRTAEFLAA